MDFDNPVCVTPEKHLWETSPEDGVSRLPLERVSPESGHTTSFVRFAPDSFFPAHPHPKGEEIYVLEGVFSDQHGDYPAGTYIRNPPGSRHRPFSKEGCMLFVKLDQFQQDDTTQIVLRREDQQWLPGIGNLKVSSLHNHNAESTALVWWPADEVFQPHNHPGGEEIVVISGKLIDEYGEYPQGSWIRNPHMSKHFPRVEMETLILVKSGHLTNRQEIPCN